MKIHRTDAILVGRKKNLRNTGLSAPVRSPRVFCFIGRTLIYETKILTGSSYVRKAVRIVYHAPYGCLFCVETIDGLCCKYLTSLYDRRWEILLVHRIGIELGL